jgi:hypothetical protein|tara:strand:+ start:122 stop:343 length:222 start_codon:yes stop_codon:yes gene_type:complete
MNPDELAKGELYRVDLGSLLLPSDSPWNSKIVLYLGSENPLLNLTSVTNYCFLVGGEQRTVDRYFLKNIKELK